MRAGVADFTVDSEVAEASLFSRCEVLYGTRDDKEGHRIT